MPAVEIIEQELTLVKKIGEGGFSSVFHMIWKSKTGDIDVAAKCLNKVDHHEVEVLSTLDHPNIVRLVGHVPDELHYKLILEFCENGSLGRYLRDHTKPLPSDLFDAWSKEAAKAIEYLQKMKIIHKDIKSENYLITKDNVLKLTDFGLAKRAAYTLSRATERGTAAYMAPELFTEGSISPSFDIFAYGVVLWELYTVEVPYDKMEYQVIIYHVCHNRKRLQIPADCPRHLAGLMRQCWLEDRHQRPSIKDILTVLNQTNHSDDQLINPADSQECPRTGTWLYESKFGHQTGPGRLKFAGAVALCQNGDVAVGDQRLHHGVNVYTDEGRLFKQRLVTTHGLKPGQQSLPCGLTVASDGTFFVTDNTQYVKVFTENGEFKMLFAAVSMNNIPSDAEQTILHGLAMDSKEQLLVGELEHQYISKHTQEGVHLGSIQVHTKPKYIAVTPQDAIILSSETPNSSVLIVNQAGEHIHTIDRPTGLTTWNPYDVSVSNGLIFIASEADDQSWVTCYTLSGEYQGHIDITNEVSNPRAIALSVNGTKMMVTDDFAGVVVFCRL